MPVPGQRIARAACVLAAVAVVASAAPDALGLGSSGALAAPTSTGAVSAGAVSAGAVAAAGASAGASAGAAATDAASAGDTVVNPVPADSTPQVGSGAVHAVVQVGGIVVVGGAFSQVTPASAGAGPVARTDIFAYDPATGALVDGFTPRLDGEVDALAPGPDGHSVFVGGEFRTVDGQPARGVARLDLTTGAPVDGFAAPVLDGDVADLAVAAGRLYLAGTFTTVDGSPHAGLATVSATTGTLDPYLSVQVAGDHNGGGLPTSAPVGVRAIAIAPNAGTLVAVGNFTTVDGFARDQIVMLNLGSTATVDQGWATTAFATACTATAFDSWVRNVAFSPDGSYFVVVSTGGAHSRELCDSAARFDTSTRGSNVSPAWVDRTGGDSLYAVAISDVAVYVAGHQRWLNNVSGLNRARPGAVPRPGIAALDPLTGLPLSWNPGRNPRGVGVWALYLTPEGLFVGSDTDCIGPSEPGNCTTYVRPKLALFPSDGGQPPASTATALVPGDAVSLGAYALDGYGDDVSTSAFTGTSATPQPTPDLDGTAWSNARGAVLVGGTLFYGWADGTLHARSFDGRTFGPDRVVDPYNDPVWSDIRTGSYDRDGNPIRYRGVVPSFYAEIPQLTSMFYEHGRLYYTVAGSATLFWRVFLPDSGIVSPRENTVSSQLFDASRVAGAFLGGDTLYWADATDGSLHATAFRRGLPVAGTDRTLTGPGIAGRDWRARAMVLTAPLVPAPAHVTVTLDGRRQTVRWTKVAAAPGAVVVVRRATGVTAPPRVVDGTSVFRGTGTTVTDSGLSVGTTYTYALWTVLPDGTQSAPVTKTSTALLPPSVRAPSLASAAGKTTTYRVHWSSPTSRPVGVRYDVSWAIAGGAPRAWLSATSATSAVFGGGDHPTRAVAGRTYTVTVTARDRYGNHTLARSARTTEPYNEGVARAATHGWRSTASSTAWLRTVRYTTTKAARLVATLTGTRFAIIGPKSRVAGRFKVYVDGHYAATVGAWAATTRPRQVLWTSRTLAARRHTIGVVNLATHGHPRLTVDGYAAFPKG